MNIKEQLFYRLWKEKDKAILENWLYTANSIEMEALLGKDNYLSIISEWYSNLTLTEMKDFIREQLPNTLKEEYNKYAKPREQFIKARCIKDEVTDQVYLLKEYKNLKIGQEYAVLEITYTQERAAYFRIVEFSSEEPYFFLAPAELFEITDKSLPEAYTLSLTDGRLEIQPREFSEYNRKPAEYSIWEDYYNGHYPALKTVEGVLERLCLYFK